MTIISAQDIFNLNKDKEYTLTASSILEKVLTDSRICSQAAKLWHYLYNKSKYDAELCLRISYSKIAKAFEKSVRTIARWVNSLFHAGYLNIKHNYDQSGSQISNTLFVRLPKDVFEQVSMTKNRSSKQNDNTFTVLKNTYPKVSLPPETQASLVLTEVEERDESAPDLRTEIKAAENSVEAISAVKEILTDTPVPEDIVLPPSVETEQNISEYLDKIVRGEDDSFDRHNILAFKEEENNNNTTVVVHASESLQFLEQEILQINTSLQHETENLKLALKEHTLQNTVQKQAAIMERIRQLEDYKYHLELKKKDHLSSLEQRNLSDKKEAFLSENLTAILNRPGERIFADSLFKRLLETLAALGHTGRSLVRFVNEIVFECRFGSLTKTKNGDNLPLEKAVNIGIKLLREKRWQTPYALSDFVQQSVVS